MSWTSEAQRRAVEAVHSGARDFALILDDGTEYGVSRAHGRMGPPQREADGAWRATNSLVEFPPFVETRSASVVAVAVYDGAIRLLVAPIGPIAVTERVQAVLRPGDLMVGLTE